MRNIADILDRYEAEKRAKTVLSAGPPASFQMCQEFQKEGAIFLAKRRYAMLADPMGVGKTIQSIAAADLIQAQNAVITCPAVARRNWIAELLKFKSRFTNIKIIESGKDIKSIKQGDTVITSYALVQKLPDDLRFTVGILDEGHLLKNRMSQRTELILFPQMLRAGKMREDKRLSLIEKCDRIWNLTGTPTPNNPAEFYTITKAFRLHNLNHFGFIDYFCEFRQDGYGGTIISGVKKEREEEFKKMLDLFMLRRTKDEIGLQLPPLIFSSVHVKPDKSVQKQAEFDVQQAIASQMDAEKLLGEAPSMSALRRQYGLEKVKGSIEYIKEALKEQQFNKVIVFCHHRDVLSQIHAGLKDYKAVYLQGGMSPSLASENIAKFQTNSETRVIVASILMSATAINLQAADAVVFVELDWVPGNNAQAVGRMHRMGQQNNGLNVVFVNLDGCELDENITYTLRHKTKMINSYVKSDKQSELKYGK